MFNKETPLVKLIRPEREGDLTFPKIYLRTIWLEDSLFTEIFVLPPPLDTHVPISQF